MRKQYQQNANDVVHYRNDAEAIAMQPPIAVAQAVDGNYPQPTPHLVSSAP